MRNHFREADETNLPLDNSFTSFCSSKALRGPGFIQNSGYCASYRSQKDPLILGPITRREKKEKERGSLKGAAIQTPMPGRA